MVTRRGRGKTVCARGAYWALLCSPSTSPLEVSRHPYPRMARVPYVGYTSAVSPSFEWDPAKDAENQRKHGVAFVDAQLAFLDPARVIAKDLSHSKGEPRFYCFGETGSGVLTVRFTYRGDVIRIIGAGYWRRGKKIYEAQSQVPR